MLNGKIITLRPIRESDLDQLRDLPDLDNRGDYCPSRSCLSTRTGDDFARTGFWGGIFVRLLIEGDPSDRIIGQIFLFKTVQNLDQFRSVTASMARTTGRRAP